jgi:general stress protein 26
MTTDLRDKSAVEARLWEEIEASRLGMLGEPESGRLWFYVKSDSDIAIQAQGAAEALFVFISADRKLQASIRGVVSTNLDILHRDKYWNATVAAWYPKGKEDPGLTMLRLDCKDAQVWISEVGLIRFGLEIARANLTGAEPHVGGRVSLDLA